MNLDQIRKNIDKIDKQIVQLISLRQSYMPRVAQYKKENSLPIFHSKREKKILESKKELAKKLKIKEELVEKIFKLIIKDSREIQKKHY